METKTMKTVFTVVERGQGKSYWTRVGVGFVNRDGSTTIRLDAIPVNGTLQVRDWEAPHDRRPNEAGGRSEATLPPRDSAQHVSFQETRSSERAKGK